MASNEAKVNVWNCFIDLEQALIRIYFEILKNVDLLQKIFRNFSDYNTFMRGAKKLYRCVHHIHTPTKLVSSKHK